MVKGQKELVSALVHEHRNTFETDRSCADISIRKNDCVGSVDSLSAKIFIEFIALIVKNWIYNLLKETLLRMETRQNYMTVPAALREREKIEMVKRTNGQYRLDHAVSKKQKKY